MSRPEHRCRGGRRDLVQRLAPFVPSVAPKPEVMVSAEPIRWWLEGWVAATGDTAAVVARGFGLDRLLVRELLDGGVSSLSTGEFRRVSFALGIEFSDGLGRRPHD